jgi:phospholipase C
MESVYNAKFKDLPHDFRALNSAEIILFRKDPYATPFMPKQEVGVKPSNGLAYQLYTKAQLNPEKKTFDIRFICSNQFFGKKSLGSPFNVYAPGKYLQKENGSLVFKELRTWAFAVKPAEHLDASWPLSEFENGIYHLRVYGPNGFYREFRGSENDPGIDIDCAYQITGTKNQPVI